MVLWVPGVGVQQSISRLLGELRVGGGVTRVDSGLDLNWMIGYSAYSTEMSSYPGYDVFQPSELEG